MLACHIAIIRKLASCQFGGRRFWRKKNLLRRWWCLRPRVVYRIGPLWWPTYKPNAVTALHQNRQRCIQFSSVQFSKFLKFWSRVFPSILLRIFQHSQRTLYIQSMQSTVNCAHTFSNIFQRICNLYIYISVHTASCHNTKISVVWEPADCFLYIALLIMMMLTLAFVFSLSHSFLGLLRRLKKLSQLWHEGDLWNWLSAVLSVCRRGQTFNKWPVLQTEISNISYQSGKKHNQKR